MPPTAQVALISFGDMVKRSTVPWPASSTATPVGYDGNHAAISFRRQDPGVGYDGYETRLDQPRWGMEDKTTRRYLADGMTPGAGVRRL